VGQEFAVKVPDGFAVGVETHTGLSRSVNEDDYLIVALAEDRSADQVDDGEPAAASDASEADSCILLAVVADGMGGVAGGSEASRAGLRGFAAGFLRAVDASSEAADREAAMRFGFESACARVVEQAQLVPALRDMGTTMTALAFYGDGVVLGHVGDTRAYRFRDGELQQLTTDHASREHSNRLLRCIGGGQSAEVPDVLQFDTRPGDRFLICSDGIWNTVPADDLVGLFHHEGPELVAQRLIERANRAGGPDNATALVLCLSEPSGAGSMETALPLEESSRLAELTRQTHRLGLPRWPWLLLLFSALLITVAAIYWASGFDGLAWLFSWF